MYSNRHVLGVHLVEHFYHTRQYLSLHYGDQNRNEKTAFRLCYKRNLLVYGLLQRDSFLLASQLVDLRNLLVFYVIHSLPHFKHLFSGSGDI